MFCYTGYVIVIVVVVVVVVCVINVIVVVVVVCMLRIYYSDELDLSLSYVVKLSDFYTDRQKKTSSEKCVLVGTVHRDGVVANTDIVNCLFVWRMPQCLFMTYENILQ